MLQTGPTQSDRVVDLFGWTFPSVCLLCVCNMLFNDAVLFAVRIVGNRLPAVVQRAARTTNAALNLAGAAAGYLWVYSNCSPWRDVCSSNVLINVNCTKSVALSLCALLALSLSDRVFLILLYPEHFSSFAARAGECGAVVIAWQMVSEREGVAALFVALLIARRARFAIPTITRYACGFFRLAVASIALNALGKNCNTVSQKASVGILISTLLLSTTWTRKPHQNTDAQLRQPLPQSPKRRRRLPPRKAAEEQTTSPFWLEKTRNTTMSTRKSSWREVAAPKQD